MTTERKDNRIIFEGLCKWATIPPRPARKGYETEDTAYSILVECSKEKFAKLMKAKLPALTKLAEEDGKTYIRVKATKTKGDLEFRDIPVVDQYGDAFTQNVGNGSTVKVIATLDDIKGKSGKVLRLKGVQVIDLVPFEDTDKAIFEGVTTFVEKAPFDLNVDSTTESNETDYDDDLYA